MFCNKSVHLHKTLHHGQRWLAKVYQQTQAYATMFDKQRLLCGSSNQFLTCSTTTVQILTSVHVSIASSRKSYHTTCNLSSEPLLKLESSLQNEQTLTISACGQNMVIPAVWLRDHCRSPKYYNHDTQQKNADLNLLDRNLTIDSVDMTGNKSGVMVSWSDGHRSEYSVDWLLSNYYTEKPKPSTIRMLWDKAIIESHPLPVVSHYDHMTLEAGLARTVENLCKFGFAIVDGAEATEAATQEVVERITFVQETLFGKMWTFTSDAERSDTAYSTQALGPHTDLTYMSTPAGIQVFHCLKHTGKGGETLLVDGFHCMEMLHELYPEEFDLLSETEVPHEYKEKMSSTSPGYHMYSLGTVVRTHPSTEEFIQLRFNPYDRAPLNTVDATDIPAFYRAYDRLLRIISDPKGQFWIKLSPGQVLLIDNWRVMHGRAAFDGTRMMCGCYLPRDEWVSKARTMGVW
ncbi:trimethyllysine dioxygenase, mitochondrial [Plakobranchus ocellatus]|uniref:Trimethyllysine dioxygenase, mitochondrial n=1 Tax=Plakobranchus ocellatus TaxID=259542 RepID=A0AAV4C605_9GAST|nr:trimethyllysine dioxygenase, mitochondrial [Plakobranchus ocellatus]